MDKTENKLQNYLKKNGANLQVADYVKVVSCSPVLEENLNDALFDSIIVDGYDGFSEEVKTISNLVNVNFKVFFGRREKTIIKKVIDYESYYLLSSIDNIEVDNIVLTKIIKQQRTVNYDKIISCKSKYFDNLKKAIIDGDKNRISDYINFLYSKALIHNEFKNRSAYEICNENQFFLKKILTQERFDSFLNICSSKKSKMPYLQAVALFNELYQQEILSDGLNLNDVVAVNFNQDLFDSFKSKEDFISYVYTFFSNIYRSIKNHRSLILKIENIMCGGVNIKWELYSFFTIYAENFIEHEESRHYYKPEEVCVDFIEHKYKIELTDELEYKLKRYFKNELEFEEVTEIIAVNVPKSEVDFFRKIHSGFQFIDCLILKSETSYSNSEDISFIENKNELLLVFSKHEIDDRKIPCPICSSLNISGNSYPAIGIKSWECKNDLCSERSKTNRGKRYSSRSNDMQTGVFDEDVDNKISKELIAKWRKDIISESSVSSMFEMIIRYFSYKGGNLLFLNFNQSSFEIPAELFVSRSIVFENILEKYPSIEESTDALKAFRGGEFISKFLYNYDKKNSGKKVDFAEIHDYKIVNSDCLTYLKTFSKNSIAHMVTSPPYYNAREYSQWKNLYNYLNDMYKICLASFDAMKPGGVFFYNIGDIFDNPNTVVKSKMGEKRLALGAYLILLFKSAGFELLDNIIWDKGETQSNRHKNDGNFTPYYQRPANCYEHMFIFKKPGKLSLCINPLMRSNIQKFSPVIKINSKGENLFGHTAPYPPELPLISIKTFTTEGDLVFDPFLGSGTSVYSAVLSDRRGLGTEMDKVYFELARVNIEKKINQTIQGELF